MASLPQRPAGQQRQQSQQPSPESSSSQQHLRSTLPHSAASEDSQAVLLSHPSSPNSSPKASPGPDAQPHQPHETQRPQLRTATTNTEPRSCWICLQTETEDTPASSRWRSPCPCALTAHETCLLDWVADLEAPKPGQALPGNPKIQCPMCKADIHLHRPTTLVLNAVQEMERISDKVVPFILGGSLVGLVNLGLWIHGYATVYMVFGSENVSAMLRTNYRKDFVNLQFKTIPPWTLPIIPIALIASRTSYADDVLRFLPMVYFAAHSLRGDGSLWPPSTATTLAVLPYVREVYYRLWRALFSEKEKAWMKEIQPRAVEEEDGNEQGGQNQAADNQDREGLNIQLGVDINFGEAPEGAPREPEQGPAGEGPAQAPGQQNQNQNPDQNGPRPRGFTISLTDLIKLVTKTVTGALLFPAISTAMGALLKASLPLPWTTLPMARLTDLSQWKHRRPAGFLQTKFGRTIAGGCLFIVLKDSFLLYSKYQLAQSHRLTSIVDYDPNKGQERQV